jgi:hypothetical protein
MGRELVSTGRTGRRISTGAGHMYERAPGGNRGGVVRHGQHGRKSRFLLWTSLLTLTIGGFLAVPIQAATASPAASGTTGLIEICKSAKNGMSGQSFSFTLNGGTPFNVVGGGCSAAITTPAGKNTVVEQPTSGTVVKAIKATGAISVDLASGTIVVKVAAGTKPSGETVVTYTNAPLPVLGLKVCKQAAPSAPSLVGDKFSFTENGGAAYSVKAGAAGSPVCGPVHSYKSGTKVNVAEAATAGTFVSGITVSDNRGSNIDPDAGTATATIGSGVTVVTYTNNVLPVPDAGHIEVCKTAGDNYVTGSFDFTVTDSSGLSSTQTVAVGHCTQPLLVAPGNVTVTETLRSPYFVSAITVSPPQSVVSVNLGNRTATATVPLSDVSHETVFTFENSTTTGLLKVCKTLTDESAALAGQTFSFTVADVNGSHTLTFAAGDAGTTTCVLDSTALPIGSAVSITEQAVPGALVVAVSVTPVAQDAGSAAPTAKLTVNTGIVTATFTNEASGTLEVCKAAADASTKTQTFQFSVNGGDPIAVKAGTCSKPISVPAGTATVSETELANFHLVSVAANLGRLVTGSTVNPATVSVPLGGVANETVVTFTNAVDTGQFKICKVSSEPTLQGVTFHFTYSYTAYGNTVTGTAAMTPGSCSGISVTVPLVDSTGVPVAIKVTEKATPTVAVSKIGIDNGTIVSQNLAGGTATFNVNQGITIVTFTNVRTPVNP